MLHEISGHCPGGLLRARALRLRAFALVGLWSTGRFHGWWSCCGSGL